MAQVMAERGSSFYCVFSRTYEKARAFADKYGIEKVYKNADELFEDDRIDVVYIATPHNCHIEYILKAAKSKKHVLCEKAITLSSDELDEAIKTCNESGVILAEAQTIYHMPVYKEAMKFVENGTLGRLKLIEVNFGTKKEYDVTNRFFSPDLAGGAMLDIGVYALSFVRYFLSENAECIKSAVTLAPTGVDEQAVMLLSNSKGEMASVNLSFTAKLPRTAVASFENGYILFDNFNRSTSAQIVFTGNAEPIALTSDSSVSPLLYEIEDMENAVLGIENNMLLEFTADVMDIMTKARKEWGVKLYG